MIKEFFRRLTKSLIVILVVSLIFSNVSFDVKENLRKMFSNVFEHSSENAQQLAISKLENTCNSISQGTMIYSTAQICNNESILLTMKENCRRYRELQARGIPIENEDQVRKSCNEIESVDLKDMCRNGENVVGIDLKNLQILCDQYKRGGLDKKSFFIGFLASPAGNQINAIEFAPLTKLNNFNRFLSSNIFIYIGLIAFFVCVLFLLSNTTYDFLSILEGTAQSAGLVVLLPYILVTVFDYTIGINTSSMLEGIFSAGPMLEPKSIASVLALFIKSMYTTKIIIIGSVLALLGISGKLINYFSNRKKNK